MMLLLLFVRHHFDGNVKSCFGAPTANLLSTFERSNRFRGYHHDRNKLSKEEKLLLADRNFEEP